jgi:hypothetical protein
MKRANFRSLETVIAYVRRLRSEDIVRQRQMLGIKQEILAKLSAKMPRRISGHFCNDTTFC